MNVEGLSKRRNKNEYQREWVVKSRVKFFPKLVRMNIEGRGSSKVRSVKVFSKNSESEYRAERDQPLEEIEV